MDRKKTYTCLTKQMTFEETTDTNDDETTTRSYHPT